MPVRVCASESALWMEMVLNGFPCRFLFATSNCFCVFILFFSKERFEKWGDFDPTRQTLDQKKKCLNLALFWSGENHPAFPANKTQSTVSAVGWAKLCLVLKFHNWISIYRCRLEVGEWVRWVERSYLYLHVWVEEWVKFWEKDSLLVLTGHSKLRTNLSDSMCEGIDTRFFWL